MSTKVVDKSPVKVSVAETDKDGKPVFEKDGVTPKMVTKEVAPIWVVNMSEYRYPHGTREGVVFEPKEPTRVIPDAWIAGQHPIMQVIDDPHGDLPESPITNETPLLKAASAAK